MKFGETLRMLMEEHSITPKQLVKVLRISIVMLTNYTHCILEPDYETLKRIAAFFEVRIDDLLDYRGALNKSEHQMEDELIQIFSDMTPKQQRLFLEHGKIIARVCAESKKSSE